MHRERAFWDGSLVLFFLRGVNGKHTELLIALEKTCFLLLLVGLLQFPMAQHEKEGKKLEMTSR